MKQLLLPITFALCAFFTSCAGGGLIQDQTTIERIGNRLAERQAWLPTLPQDLTADERQALEFLYAWLPSADVADYDVDFYLSAVRSSLATREQMPWGKEVDEREFLHFVLPVRVNNEALDSSRTVFFNELKDRVKGLSMKDAILEVNHWCHEKVNYSPTDARTMSPLAMVKNATGRCGEESTFAVAALRSVGIPARQIYVPRWAHTDDNHAWVEAWAADGKGSGQWYYIGACEPEAVLNTGWFDAPAKRSLMMLTKVFGQYNGPEQMLSAADGYTEISVTENYAPVATATVVVEGQDGQPIEGAQVLYTIYNYATFYPAARRVSDSKGESSLTAGKGDMVVFASKDGQIASGVLDFRTADTLRLTLGALPNVAMEYDITPPDELPVEVKISDEARALNLHRFASEDSIRGAYIATFIDQKASDELAQLLGADKNRVWNIMSQTRGNHPQIAQFLTSAPRENVSQALDLLEVISAKDLRDTPCEVLLDHLTTALPWAKKQFFKEYILNPRVDNELLTKYRNQLKVGSTMAQAQTIIDQYADIAIVDSLNPARLAISPVGVARIKMGDRASVERLVIAALRSNGIAARREPLSARGQYFMNDAWHYIQGQEIAKSATKGTLTVLNEPSNTITDNPKLDTHFSLSKWNGERYVPVQFESLGIDLGGAATLADVLPASHPLPIEQGQYMLTTGTRLSSGKVLARNEPITIQQDRLSKTYLVMRQASNEISVIGAINPEEKYVAQGATAAAPLLATTGRGYFVVAMIEAKKEPTTHFLRALGTQKAMLEKWGRPIVLILSSKEQLASLNLKDFPELPSTVSFGYDENKAMSKMIGSMCEIKDMNSLPVVVLGDSFGRVVYISTGYNTSLGEQMAATIKML